MHLKLGTILLTSQAAFCLLLLDNVMLQMHLVLSSLFRKSIYKVQTIQTMSLIKISRVATDIFRMLGFRHYFHLLAK